MADLKLKPVICVLNPDDIYYLQKYSNCPESLPYCATIQDVKNLKKKGVDIPEALCKENVILTQLPSQNKYVRRTPAEENNIIEYRIKAIGNILSYLGAKSCSISYSSSTQTMDGLKTNTNLRGDFNANVLGYGQGYNGNVKVGTDNNNQSIYEKSLLSENTWPGNYTEEGYKRAKEIAIEAGLDQDDGIKALFEQRNPYHHNPVSANHYRVDLYSSMKKSLEIATSIQVGISKSLSLPLGPDSSASLNLGLDVDVAKNEYAESHEIMELSIEFGSYIPKEGSSVSMSKAVEMPAASYSGSNNNSISTGKLLAIVVGAVVAAVALTVVAMKFL